MKPKRDVFGGRSTVERLKNHQVTHVCMARAVKKWHSRVCSVVCECVRVSDLECPRCASQVTTKRKDRMQATEMDAGWMDTAK